MSALRTPLVPQASSHWSQFEILHSLTTLSAQARKSESHCCTTSKTWPSVTVACDFCLVGEASLLRPAYELDGIFQATRKRAVQWAVIINHQPVLWLGINDQTADLSPFRPCNLVIDTSRLMPTLPERNEKESKVPRCPFPARWSSGAQLFWCWRRFVV